MTKKDKILKIFNELEWLKSPSGQSVKAIHYDDFLKAGFSPTIEYGEHYCDVIYARRIFQKMGYRVIIGTYSLQIYKQP